MKHIYTEDASEYGAGENIFSLTNESKRRVDKTL
jgi:hypothetical protein